MKVRGRKRAPARRLAASRTFPARRIQKAQHPLIKLGFLCLGLGSLLGALWLVSSSGMVTNRFKPQLETELSQLLNRTVTVEHLEGGIFDRVILKHVRISAKNFSPHTVDLTIERVVVQYSLWDILVRKKALANSLHQIEFIKPLIQYERLPDGKWQGPDFATMALFQKKNNTGNIPAIKIILSAGEFRLLSGQDQASIRNLKGLLNLKDPTASRLYFSGRTNNRRLQNIRLSGWLDLTAGTFKLGLNASKVDLAPWAKLVPHNLLNLENGQADLQLNLASQAVRPSHWIPGIGIDGKVVLYDLTVKLPMMTEPLKNIYGVGFLQNNRLLMKNMQAVLGKTAWSARGMIANLLDPEVQIRVQSENLQLSDLITSFPRFAQLHTHGSGRAAFLIKGKIMDPLVTANFVLSQGSIGRLGIEKVELISRYHAGELRLLLAQGIFAQGWIDGHGSILLPEDQGPATLHFQGVAKNLQVQDLASLLGLKEIQGQVSGRLNLEGDLNHPRLTGEITSPQMSLSGMKFKQVAGQLELSDQKVLVQVKTDWGMLSDARLKIQAFRKGPGWRIQPLMLSQGDRILLKAEGEWGTRGEDSLSARLLTQSMPIQTLPILPPMFKHLNGVINLSGKLEGTVKKPQFMGVFDSPRLMALDSVGIDAQGEVVMDANTLRLNNVWLDRKRINLQGNMELVKPHSLQGVLTLTQVPCKTLTVLSGLNRKEFPQGRINGKVAFSGTLQQLVSQGNIGLTQVKWSVISADKGSINFTSNGKRFWLKQMELIQPAGKFNASLEMDLEKTTGAMQMLAWMDTFQLGQKKWSGNLKLNGSQSALGKEDILRLLVDNLEVNEKKLPSLEGQLLLTPAELRIQHLNWGKELSLTGVVLRQDRKQAKLALLLDKTNLEGLRAVLDKTKLSERLSGSIRLVLEEETAKTQIQLKSGGEELAGEANWQWPAGAPPALNTCRLQLKQMSTPLIFDLFMLADPARVPSGTASGELQLRVQKGELKSMTGDLEFSNFHFGRWIFKTLKTAWEMDNNVFKLKRLEGIQPQGSLNGLEGSMSLNPDGSRLLKLNLLAKNFFFFTKHFHGNFAVTGKMMLKPFDLRLSVVSPDFGLNLYTFGDFKAEIHYAGDNLSIRTPPDYPTRIVGDLLLPDGGAVIFQRLTIADDTREYVNMTGKAEVTWTSDVLVKVKDVKADLVARCMGWPQTWTGIASGSVHYREMPEDNNTYIKIAVKVENGSIIGLPFDSFSGNVILDHDWLHFKGSDGAAQPDAAVLRRQGKYTMYLSGKIPLPQSALAEEKMKGAEMDMRVSMPEGDSSYLVFVPYIAEASGKSALDLNIRGTMDYPSLFGRATIHQGTLSPRLYTPWVEQVEADLKFEDNKVFIQRFEGKIGEGFLKVSAGPNAPWAVLFRRLMPDQLNLKLDTENGRIKLDTTKDYEFISAWLTMHALITGTLDAPVLSGPLEFYDGQFTYPPRLLSDFAKQMKSSNVSYDHFKLVTRKNLWFYNDMVRAQTATDQSVLFNGGKHDFSGEGRVAIAKGSFTYLETDFTLDPNQETAVSFRGRGAPQLNGLAQTVIRNVEIKDEGRQRDATIYLHIQGDLGELKINLDSDPKMTQAQIMSLLTLGEDYSSWSKTEIDQKVQAAGARMLGRYASSLIGRELEKNIKKYTPLDVIDIRLGGVEKLANDIMTGNGNTNTGSSTRRADNPGTSLLQDTQIDVGKYLTDTLFLNYRGTLKDRGEEKGGLAWQSYLGLEYNIDSSKKIKVYKNFDESSNEELFWGIEGRSQFKGWSPSEFKDTQEEKPPPQKTPTPAKR